MKVPLITGIIGQDGSYRIFEKLAKAEKLLHRNASESTPREGP
jgi:GDP-D-mannose dehydratase